MEVEYHLTFDDLMAFNRHHQKHGLNKVAPLKLRGWWAWGPYVAAVGFAVALTVTYPLTKGYGMHVVFLVGLLVGMALFAFLAVGLAVGRTRSLREFFEEGHARWILAPRRLTISPEGFRVVNYYVDAMNRWEQVWQISVTEDYAFFYLTPIMGHVLPRRAFADRREFEAFVALAQEYHEGRLRLPARLPQSEGITTSPTPPILDVLPYDTP
jgi:hypothetical protein